MSRYRTYGELDSPPIEELEAGFKGYNNYLRPDQLPVGILAESLNGRFDINGEWQPRKGIDIELNPFTTPDFILPFYAYADETSSALSAIVASTITITINGHSFNDQTIANVSGITGVTPDPNGNRIITVVDANNISITVSGISGTPAGTATVGAAKLGAATEIYGAESYYDDSASNKAYIIIASDSTATAYDIEAGTTTDIDYPAGVTLSANVQMKQFQNKMFIFIDGSTALEWDGDLSGSPAFTRVANGAYSGVGELSGTLTITDGLAVFDNGGAHSLSANDDLVITDAGTTDLIEGEDYVITLGDAAGANTTTHFNFRVNISDATSTVKVLPTQSQSLGYTHQPAFPWAEVHQDRLVGPYNYTMAGSAGASPTITDREVRDEIIFSRKFNTDVYDHIYGQFKFSPGKSDYVVALNSFSDDQLVVLNRESIYVISNSQDIKQANKQLLTGDLGCVSRESVTRVGDKIVFLSDNGVYAMSFIDLYNLRGQDVPLSLAINEDIKRINWDYAQNAEAVYFDNRYYLAVPIDGSETNNAIFVYNFLNNEWESIDTVNNSQWQYKRLMVAGDGECRGVYSVNQAGGIHKLDARDDGQDYYAVAAGGTATLEAVAGSGTTRSVTGGTVDRKKWKLWDIHVESNDSASDLTLAALVENIDNANGGGMETISLGTLSDKNGGAALSGNESGSFRGRFGRRRAYGIQYKFDSNQGRPKIRAIKFTGHQTMGSTTNAT